MLANSVKHDPGKAGAISPYIGSTQPKDCKKTP